MPIINRRMSTEFDRRRREAREQGLRITWLTDTHTWSEVDDQPEHPLATSGGDLYFYTAGKKLTQAIDYITSNPPHFTLHTGDMQERGRDFPFFMDFWGDIPGPKALTLGNHDVAFTVEAGETKHDVAAAGFGRAGAPLLGGSRFNQSIPLSGNGVNARLLILDTNIHDTGLHEAASKGYLQAPALTWLAGELAASPEDIILIASHHGPHSWWSGRFDQADAEAIAALVDAEVAARPNRRIRGIFGHWHIHHHVRTFDNLGPNFPALLAPCMVDRIDASFLDLYVDRDGYLTWDKRDVHYFR